MRTSFSSRVRRRGSIMILFTLMLPTLIVPLVGLAIDGSMLYTVQAKLQSAVDGAALGAGRLLGTNANTTEIANEFLSANFPSGYWGSYNLTPSISAVTNFSAHTITVGATVNVPLLFMRIFGYNNTLVAASAVATRRDTRVELVLDRSYSMNGNLGSMKTSAATFTNKFTNGADELGLIVFGGSAFVAYPNTVTPSTTGPNVHFGDANGSGFTNMATMINNMAVGSDTGTAEGLWTAYQELKTANTLNPDPTRLNAIVLFTDGLPNGISAFLNDPSGSNNALSSGSGCKYNPASSSDPTQDLIGWIASSGSGTNINFFKPSSSKTTGTYNILPINSSGHTASYWDSTVGGSGYVDDMVQVSGKPYTSCSNLSGTTMTGLAKIPPQDRYGNSTSGVADPQSLLYTTFKTHYDATKPTNGYQMGLASWNATDHAGQRILADTTLNITIYVIGYTGNGGVDQVLLKRLANTQDSTSYNAAYQTGMYVSAGNAAELQSAFDAVASALLRLAR
ncbi:MAG TPA: pilus assembly protein TadG-related protein [Bryobacteraceae bacterium]|nr:pilus assembly protein TadG-related protein [Bryobacteraceae bacterium]